MTELIDLATLASLGQHFSTLEEVGELRTILSSVQKDLGLIKNFLVKRHGSDFTNVIEDGNPRKRLSVANVRNIESSHPDPEEEEYVNGGAGGEVMAAAAAPKRFLVGGGKQQVVNIGKNKQGDGQRMKPPPLQRFADFQPQPANEGENTRKFHRNFLSMRTLKTASKPFGGGGGNFLGARAGNRSSPSSGIKRLSVNRDSEDSRGRGYYNVTKIPKLKLEAESNEIEVYESTEDAAYPEVDTIGDEETYELGDQMVDEDELKFVPPYDEGDDQVSLDGVDEMQLEDSMAYDLEIIDSNGSNIGLMLNNHNQTSMNGSGKKAQQRRISSAGNGNSSVKECKICHDAVPTFALFNHVINSHYEGDVPTCEICKKTFTYKQGLISHMRYHDAEKYDKACSYCGKKFIRRSDVIIHERRLHTGERPYQCPVPGCSQGFVRRYCLLTHVKTNHGEPYLSQIMTATNDRKKSMTNFENFVDPANE